MATLVFSLTTGAGNSSQTLTFSSTDAGRILSAYQKNVKPGGTQADLLAYYVTRWKRDLSLSVVGAETTTPTPPTFT